MSYTRVGLVTGANKGVGLAIVRQLALQYPQSPFNDGPLLIYLTARDQGRGEEAVQSIENDAQLKRAKALVRDGGLTEVRFRKLDISDAASIRSLGDFLRKRHGEPPSGGIDFAINNAGIAMQGFDGTVVEKTLGCNYYGTLEATREFLPLIKDGGRLVNVSSMAGKLHKYGAEVQGRFRSASAPEEVTALMEDFKKAVAEGRVQERGWVAAAYATSKAGVTGMTKTVAEREKARGRGVLVNSCCPGYVRTDMTRGGGSKTPDQGAMTPVMLAIGDVGGKSGLFWQDERPIEW